jgi:hypothetical protein
VTVKIFRGILVVCFPKHVAPQNAESRPHVSQSMNPAHRMAKRNVVMPAPRSGLAGTSAAKESRSASPLHNSGRESKNGKHWNPTQLQRAAPQFS